MELRVLAVGDVVGASGLKHLEKHLRGVKRLYGVDFCVVNGENASVGGLTPQQAGLARFSSIRSARCAVVEPPCRKRALSSPTQ